MKLEEIKVMFFIKRKKSMFMVLILLVMMGLSKTAKADEVIPSSEFEDNNFYQYVIENFDTNGDGLLQQTEAEEIRDIRLSDYHTEISSIKGIEYFTNLRAMAGYGNKLESIEPIRNLTNLVNVKISGMLISDFSPLYELSSLEELEISGTKIEDISFLANRNITLLRLSGNNNITDFSALAGLTELFYLELRCKNLKDITVLKDMKKLETLDLYDTEVEDLSILSSFENMRSLYIGGYSDENGISHSRIKDIGFLKNMKKLEILVLGGSEAIEDFTALGELTDLRHLTVWNCNNISELEVQMLSRLTKIEEIDLRDNNLETLPDMTGWTNLYQVYLGGNRITEDEAMAKLPLHIISQEDWRETTGLLNQRYNEDETDDNNTNGSIQEDETGSSETNNNIEENETTENPDDGRVITSSSDNNISVQGSFVSDIYLEATKIENTSDYEDLIKEVNNRLPYIVDTSIYDIWLYKKEIKEGENIKIKVQPNGSVKVMIKIEEQEGVSYHVFRQEDDGTLTKLDCHVEDGILIFYSEHFSIFTVVISRLMNDEENETEGNSHKSDNGNYIKVQQQGIKVPLLHEAERNGGGIAKPTDKIKNKDNDGSENNNNGNGNISSISEAGSDDGSSSKGESSSTSWENVIESVSIPFDKRDAGKSEQRKNIEGIVCIVIVCMVGVGIFGYDIMKRKRGDYMRNFQIEAINTYLDIKQ